MLSWYRSWPEVIPEGRPHIVDDLPKLIMRDCNYATLADYQPWPDQTPGWCMLEWDVALAPDERDLFVEHALEDPDRVLVAPYNVFLSGRPAQCAHMANGHPIAGAWPVAHTFGLGCIYFPKSVLDTWWAEPPKFLHDKWNDTMFSLWHWSQIGSCRVDWSVHPQHLR